ncbi:MAG: HEAT repeat domain-containing protein [Abditibacteriales bacterium]|nr:HEAT repeat domain-containing protein [Abditibacteriales bacterium]
MLDAAERQDDFTGLSVKERRKAIRALGNAPGALPLLITALNDDDSSVRRYAARRLGQFEDEAALEALLSATRDRNRFVRLEALKALERRMDDPRVLATFIAALEDRSYLGRTVAVLAARHSEAMADVVAALPAERRQNVVNNLLKVVDGGDDATAIESIRLISTLRLVEALPHLRHKLRWWRFTPAQVKEACRAAIAELERVAALPRAASTPAPPTADLPRPAAAPKVEVETLPRVPSES